WPAQAAALARKVLSAQAPARILFIVTDLSRFRRADMPENDHARIQDSRSAAPGSNHTLFPSARKQPAAPCGIFARARPASSARRRLRESGARPANPRRRHIRTIFLKAKLGQKEGMRFANGDL